MERKLGKIRIDCGKTTCASKPGKFCTFVGVIRLGTTHVCRLFPSEGHSYTPLKEDDGWLTRCRDCVDAEGED
jgi:hypothetical protein